ncbi:uncharacterized protein LOC142339990 isoform X2 [Convolutriloba macropyga]|uniref:uncharacterized protein LOC142339990 isoform X2 n=1 Tax=Convolutriloba macropyga TaxID=536237 RepID=UPI003F520021
MNLSPSTLFGLLLHGVFPSEDIWNWKSVQFAIPQPRPFFSRQCLLLEKQFCLLGLFLYARQSLREPVSADLSLFEELVRRSYTNINWYSLLRSNPGRCCDFQIRHYQFQGQSHGLSPSEYYNKLTDFSLVDKRLNWLRANYHTQTCENVVSEIGFGTGPLRMTGSYRSGLRFIIPIWKLGAELVIPRLESSIATTFRFFRDNFICHDQPWICEQYQSPVNQNIRGSRKLLFSDENNSTYVGYSVRQAGTIDQSYCESLQ